MKQRFIRDGVPTAAMWLYVAGGAGWVNYVKGINNGALTTSDAKMEFPVVGKHRRGSRGTGNTLINNQEEFDRWKRNRDLDNYIVETFHNYSREYRLHVSRNGCFYGVRKMLRNDAPQNQRWRRHDDNCVWIVEENPLFDKPVNWDAIVKSCVTALDAVGLDIGAFDVKVQSATKSNGDRRESPKWIVIESNSAPSFGTITAERYISEITRLINHKLQAQ
jgi:hypothetical protein